MLTRLVLSIDNKTLQDQLEENLAISGAQIESCGQLPTPWQQLVQSCGDILVVSETLIPHPVESSIAMLNNLPEARPL